MAEADRQLSICGHRIAVLVTGGAGYIGSHCCKALFDAGYLPVCLDDLSTGHVEFVRWGPFVRGDIANRAIVIDAFARFNIAAVVHVAASSSVSRSVIDPRSYYANNVAGTLSFLSAMLERDCRSLVFSSSGAVYGNDGGKLIREDAAGTTVSPYGASKWMIEQILTDFRKAYGLNSVCLRYFNVGGADESGMIGERRDPETHLIPRAMMVLQGHIDELTIFGDDYDTADGTAIRDYIHVSDVAAAHVASLRNLLAGHVGGSFNLGTGIGHSVQDVLAAICEETGRIVPATIGRRRAGDPAILVADPSAAKDILQFRPAFSDLKTIVHSAWNWHRQAHPARVR
ncbi:UDP-glucose 4-epimerase GalE [Bradyrhizobium sp.]|uniref:UDP-glucose 4-epimerase GalE n=1 Tax=Bradyrhizobium sp. TaxID=376 RepID=UPI004037FF36